MPFVYIALVASYFAVSSRCLAKFGICQLCKHQGQLWKPLKLCCIKWEQSLLTTWKLSSVLAVDCVVPGNVWDIYVKHSVSVGEMDSFSKSNRACCCCLLAPGMQRWTQECPVHHYGSFTRVVFCAKTWLGKSTFYITPGKAVCSLNCIFKVQTNNSCPSHGLAGSSNIHQGKGPTVLYVNKQV